MIIYIPHCTQCHINLQRIKAPSEITFKYCGVCGTPKTSKQKRNNTRTRQPSLGRFHDAMSPQISRAHINIYWSFQFQPRPEDASTADPNNTLKRARVCSISNDDRAEFHHEIAETRNIIAENDDEKINQIKKKQ